MAEYYAEGLLERLLGLGTNGSVDGTTCNVLEMYTFYIVPNMNPDGAVRGHLRTNACVALVVPISIENGHPLVLQLSRERKITTRLQPWNDRRKYSKYYRPWTKRVSMSLSMSTG